MAAVRNAYAVAERKDLEGWIKLFTPDGVFIDNLHRELCRVYADGNVVVVQLALQGPGRRGSDHGRSEHSQNRKKLASPPPSPGPVRQSVLKRPRPKGDITG